MNKYGYTENFEQFWKLYPNRGVGKNKGSKNASFRAYNKILATHTHEQIIESLLKYKETLERTKIENTCFVKMAHRFLSDLRPDRHDRKKDLKVSSWNGLRYKVLAKYNGKCCLCGRGASDGSIMQVDHIKPKSLYPELEFEESNLQVLCSECNEGKSNKDDTDWRS